MPPPQHVRRIPQTSSYLDVATRELYDRLNRLAIDESVFYTTLMQETGIETLPRLMGRLDTVRNHLREDEQKEFDYSRGQVMRLSEGGKLGKTGKRGREINTRLKTNIAILRTVDNRPLTPSEKYDHLVQMSVNLVAYNATEDKTRREMAATQQPKPLQIDPQSVKELYKDLFQGF